MRWPTVTALLLLYNKRYRARRLLEMAGFSTVGALTLLQAMIRRVSRLWVKR
jgi:hypothetical protein